MFWSDTHLESGCNCLFAHLSVPCLSAFSHWSLSSRTCKWNDNYADILKVVWKGCFPSCRVYHLSSTSASRCFPRVMIPFCIWPTGFKVICWGLILKSYFFPHVGVKSPSVSLSALIWVAWRCIRIKPRTLLPAQFYAIYNY